MEVSNIKLIVDLTIAKLDIQKLKADHYTWFGQMSQEDRKMMDDTLDEINELLKELRNQNT